MPLSNGAPDTLLPIPPYPELSIAHHNDIFRAAGPASLLPSLLAPRATAAGDFERIFTMIVKRGFTDSTIKE